MLLWFERIRKPYYTGRHFKQCPARHAGCGIKGSAGSPDSHPGCRPRGSRLLLRRGPGSRTGGLTASAPRWVLLLSGGVEGLLGAEGESGSVVLY